MKTLLIVWLSFLMIANSYSQNEAEIVKNDLKKDEIKSHMSYIASDELMGRDTPSEGLEKAAAYLADHLKRYGVKSFADYDNYYQPVKLKIVKAPESIAIKIGDNEITKTSKAYLFAGKNTDIEEDIVFLNYGLKKDIQENDVKGKIIIANVGNGKAQSPRDNYFLSIEKTKLAKEAGAVAIIELYPNIPYQIAGYITSEKLQLDLEKEEDGDFPHIFLDVKSEEINSTIAKAEDIHIEIKGNENNRFISNNVMGFVEGTDKTLKDEYIVCTAHYDHVGVGRPDAEGDSIYNGARDNAVGVTSLLVSAKNIAKDPLKRPVIFVFFTGEEKGLLGSNWFINNPPVEPQQMVYCLNNDNGSYTDTTIVSIPGLSKINTENIIKEACNGFGLTATDDFPEANMLYSASDNVHFSKIGIPSVTYSLGFTSFNAEIREYYHQPKDEAESINYNYLYKFCGGYNLSLRLIGNMGEQPFWKEGEEYYDTGKKLYNN